MKCLGIALGLAFVAFAAANSIDIGPTADTESRGHFKRNAKDGYRELKSQELVQDGAKTKPAIQGERKLGDGCCAFYGNSCAAPLDHFCHRAELICTGSQCGGEWIYPEGFKSEFDFDTSPPVRPKKPTTAARPVPAKTKPAYDAGATAAAAASEEKSWSSSSGCCSFLGDNGACSKPESSLCHTSQASCTGLCGGTWVATQENGKDTSNKNTLSSQCCSKTNPQRSDLSPSSWCHTSKFNCIDKCSAMWICPGGAMKSETESFGAFTTPTAKPPTAKPPTAKPPTHTPPTNIPLTQTPPTNKPPTAKPPTVTPPTAKPPTRKPPTVKPPTNKRPGTVAAVKQQPRSQNICTCKRSWTSEDGGKCGKPQYGCPATACDDGSPDSWCIVEDPNCDSGELDNGVVWSYCEPDACVCKDRWTHNDDDGCKNDQYGCPVEACDGYSHTWCVVEDGNCATAEEDNGVSWSYCGTGL